MAFRADEAAQNGREQAERYLVTGLRGFDEAERDRSKKALGAIIDELGPVVDRYPIWHPLVGNQAREWAAHPSSIPDDRCGYKGLDHTIFFANGFITCPYQGEQDVITSVNALPENPAAIITAEVLDVHLYNPTAIPVLVKCEWEKPLNPDGTIPLSVAMPLILENELPCWRWSQVGETWETMRPYFLGTPHGSRSSLFINQETGQAIKKIWNALIATEMFGPIMK